MIYYLTKIVVTAGLVVIISEVGKRNTFLAAILASVPTVSLLALVWLYQDTGNVTLVTSLAKSIFWLVLPSLTFFIALPLLLGMGVNFYLSLVIATSVTACCYWGLVAILHYYGVQL
ncbi:DUF3147 family protein [Desulforhopalus singaporensis]|uniref:DUF3147 family protein n=1 Tax=Desulforhopalus singaporensis TaxID=91360 RepID=A0A1H0LAQ3_9BACT|nr:DUF3147 family protein [Desulforhopalus singaporensis]SDO65146.1 hypothetical protein SAMN05660330_00724 [Desulforhopalus singaporensis]